MKNLRVNNSTTSLKSVQDMEYIVEKNKKEYIRNFDSLFFN